MKASESIKREIAKIEERINRHKHQIRKLENEKLNLMGDLHNAEFEERTQGQFANRFEVDSFRHND
ncbi:MAG: hypothetical protein E7311_04255 [Clostridiales bacterium]|nr:hypothetical protein [Clostridiales bacterium]